MAEANINPIPTAIGAGTPRNRIKTGTVTVPAPTPVSAMNSAITNPIANCRIFPHFIGAFIALTVILGPFVGRWAFLAKEQFQLVPKVDARHRLSRMGSLRQG